MFSDCECKEDGFCSRYNREMGGRLRQICQGIGVNPGEAAQYRELFAQTAKVKEPDTSKIPLATVRTGTSEKCPHLGDAVRDKDGEARTRACVSCGGSVQRHVFACKHPSREPDEVTMEDCGKCDYRPKAMGKPIILKNHLSPGDVLVMSAAIHSLHKANPGKFLTAVDTTANSVYEHNPDVISLTEAHSLGAETIDTHYPAVNESNERGITFMSAYCEFFSTVLGVPVPLRTNRPHVYLSTRERGWMDQVHELTGRKQRFWLVCAGRKSDYTTKFYGTDNYQSVIDRLRGKVTFVQVGSNSPGHFHPPLRNAINLVGKTDLRQLIRLAWHADGVLSGVTFLQHLAAAWQKPSVVVMGGREPVVWNSYPRQTLLHTVGSLSCCRTGGCWKSRIEKLNDGDDKDKSLCDNPVIGEQTIPKCMALIRPEEVAEKILLNYA